MNLLILALPIACLSWTVTHEEIFRELHDWCVHRSKTCPQLVLRKFFYLFTCEYCFSHWVTGAFLWLTGYRLLYDDWRGVLVALFALVLVANVYMTLYEGLRLILRVLRSIARFIS